MNTNTFIHQFSFISFTVSGIVVSAFICQDNGIVVSEIICQDNSLVVSAFICQDGGIVVIAFICQDSGLVTLPSRSKSMFSNQQDSEADIASEK